MKGRPLFNAQVLIETTLSKEVCGKLDRTAKARANHRSPDTAIDTLDTLAAVNLAEAVDGVLIVMLRADGKERRIGLEASLH
jgi:hypothetical protein